MDCGYKSLFKITLPIFSFLLVENIIAFTDTAFLGRVGEVELAAASIAGLYYVCVFIIGFGFSIGSQVLMAHRNGEGNFGKVGDIFTTSLYGLMALAVAGFILTWLFCGPIFSAMSHDSAVVESAIGYMKWRQFGFLAVFAIIAYRSMYVGVAKTEILAYSSWAMGAVNVLLDYVLIFGKFGFPKMGVEGAALASTLSEVAGLVIFAVYTAKKFDTKKYNLGWKYPDFKLLKNIFRLSSWTMAQQFVYVGIWLLLFAFIGNIGRHELAQSNIFRSILMFLYMPMYSFGSAVNSITGNLIGQGRPGEILPMCFRVGVIEFSLVVPALILCALFPYEIMGVYTDSASILSGARLPFYCALFTVPFSVPTIILSNMILGFERTRAALVIEAISMLPYVAGLYLCSVVFGSFAAIWTMDAWYWIIVLLLNILYIKRRLNFRADLKA